MITRLKRIKIICLLLSLSILLIPKNSFSKNGKKKNITTNKEIADIYLNFENATLSSVVNYLSEQKKINIIPIKELDNIKVSLTTREALTLNKSWDILLTLLEINGFTIIEVDNIYRLVQKGLNKQEPLPMYSGIEPEKLPDNDMVVRYIYFLKNIKAKMVQGFLVTMLEGSIQINENLDALIITDKCLSIKASMKIIKELDQGGLREAIKTIKLKHSTAEDVAKLFGEITPKEQQKNIRFLGPRGAVKKPSTYFSRDTKIIPAPRQNILILLGLEKNIDKVINFIYKYIDIPIEAAESRLHIKELKYAKAETLKPIITNIIKPPAGTAKTLQVGEYKFFKDVIIAADSSQEEEGKGGGNRLIISCDKDDWKRLDKLINSIDKPQPQITFEIMIIDVELTSDFDLWAQFKPKKEGMFGKNINPQFRTAIDSKDIDLRYETGRSSNLRTGIAGTNLTFGRLGDSENPSSLWGMIKAILSKDNYNIIIQPYITVNNNQECLIDATLTRQVAGEFSAKTVSTELVQEKKTKEAKTIVKITPKANLNGIINLKINVEITDFQTNVETDANTTTRKLDSIINLGTGEVVVLGGLTKSKYAETSYSVPLLGKIPILGNLFRSKTKKITKSNIYIFIRPSIIKPNLNSMPDEYTAMKLDYAKYQILENDTYSLEKDPIQRWFFKPSKQSSKQKLSDARKGIFRPIDKFASGFRQPKSVNIRNDSYFKPEIKKTKKIEKAKLKKQKTISPTKKRLVKKSRLKRRRKLT